MPRQRCGYLKACPVQYRVAEVNASAAEWDPTNAAHQALLATQHKAAKAACGRRSERLSSGGWCLGASVGVKTLPRNQSYGLPRHHKEADGIVVAALTALLSQGMSLLDFGAGVGQYGHALRSLDSRYRWRGYDGAGNVEQATNGFVSWFDLTLPLSLPRADWVMALEVGEHVPPEHEKMFVRNLHAHNCHGVIVSWARLGTWGHGHANNREPAYVAGLFASLGYRPHDALTAALRNGTHLLVPGHAAMSGRNYWFRRASTQAFARTVPLRSPECSRRSSRRRSELKLSTSW